MPWKSLLVSVVAGAALYFTLFAGSGFESALEAAARLAWGWWLVILSLSLMNYGIRYVRWDVYLRHLGHGLPAMRHLLVYLAGFALTTTPAKAGEAIRALYLVPLGVEAGRSIAALYAERVVDVISIALLAVMLYQLAAPGYRWVAAVAALGAGALVLMSRPVFLQAAGGFVGMLRWRRLRQGGGYALGCLREAADLLRGRLLLHGILLGTLSWGAEAAAFYLVVRELDIPIELMGAIGIYATAMLAGAMSFVPGGLGGTEVVMASLLILGGAPPPSAMAATAIIRVATLWFAVVLGLLALLAVEAAARRSATLSASTEPHG